MNLYSKFKQRAIKVGFYRINGLMHPLADVDYKEKLFADEQENFVIDIYPFFHVLAVRPCSCSLKLGAVIEVTSITLNDKEEVQIVNWREVTREERLAPRVTPSVKEVKKLNLSDFSAANIFELYDQVKADPSIILSDGLDEEDQFGYDDFDDEWPDEDDE